MLSQAAEKHDILLFSYFDIEFLTRGPSTLFAALQINLSIMINVFMNPAVACMKHL